MHDKTSHIQQVNKHRKSNQMNHIIYAGMPQEDKDKYLMNAIPMNDIDVMHFIRQVVEKATGVEDIMEKTRRQDTADARHIALYLCDRYTALPLVRIANYFGAKSHCHVIHARKKVKSLIDSDASFLLIVNSCEDVIKSKTKRISLRYER